MKLYIAAFALVFSMCGVAFAEARTPLPPDTAVSGGGSSGFVACTMEYAPVCGAREVQCITTPCHPIEETFGNRCTMEAAGAAYLYSGECRNPGAPVPDEPADTTPTPPKNCRLWNDGCNTCSNMNGQWACTLMYCLNPGTPYCREYDSDPLPRPSIDPAGSSSSPVMPMEMPIIERGEAVTPIAQPITFKERVQQIVKRILSWFSF
jgi:hypothetical protein